ncbi:MAG: carbonic anhydrase family protein [Nitrospira sp.]|nr:carbonic anhydrase family protein [Nitrospira sp.]
MKTHSMNVVALSIISIMLSGPVSASNWDHSTLNQEGSQGNDGTVWATIEGQVSPNSASFKYPYAECAIGSHQSPIAINLTTNPIPLTLNPITHSSDNNPPAEPERRADSLVVRYAPSISSTEGAAIGTDQGNAYVFRNTGHAIQVSFSAGYPGRLVIGKDVYPLVQFHFHTPSEHLVIKGQYPAGRQYEGELHFVHQREDGKLAVLGVFLDGSQGSAAEHSILKKIIENTPREPNTYNTSGSGLPLDPSKLIPTDTEQVFTYAGSLTTPPCSEGVSWYVMSEPLKVAPAQIQTLGKFFTLKNNRIVQNTNARTVEIHKDLHVDYGHSH